MTLLFAIPGFTLRRSRFVFFFLMLAATALLLSPDRASAVAPTPVLSALNFGTSPVNAGVPTTISVTATNLTSITGVTFRQPDGSGGRVTVGNFVKKSDVYTASLTVPANSLPGAWRVAE